jgi:hypothetical protein
MERQSVARGSWVSYDAVVQLAPCIRTLAELMRQMEQQPACPRHRSSTPSPLVPLRPSAALGECRPWRGRNAVRASQSWRGSSAAASGAGRRDAWPDNGPRRMRHRQERKEGRKEGRKTNESKG